jgi:hypothetical protein
MTRELYLQQGAEIFNLSREAMFAELEKINRFESRRMSGTAVDEAKLEQQKKKTDFPPNCISAMLLLLEIALNSADKAREMADLLPQDMFDTAGIYGKALGMVINEALYGEHANCYKLLNELLYEEQNPGISRLCVKDSENSEKNVDKITKDCILLLQQFFMKRKQQQLTDAMRQESDPVKRMELLKQLIQIK